jgi:hypothetical protein
MVMECFGWPCGIVCESLSVSRSRACSRRSESLTSITAFHEGVGSTGPSSDDQEVSAQVGRQVVAQVELQFLLGLGESIVLRIAVCEPPLRSDHRQWPWGSFESAATATAALGVTKLSDPMGAGAASHEATPCLPRLLRIAGHSIFRLPIHFAMLRDQVAYALNAALFHRLLALCEARIFNSDLSPVIW